MEGEEYPEREAFAEGSVAGGVSAFYAGWFWGAHARTRTPISKDRTGASPMVSSSVAVVRRLDLSVFMAARPSEAPAIRSPESRKRGMRIGRHVYGFFPPWMRRTKIMAGGMGQ